VEKEGMRENSRMFRKRNDCEVRMKYWDWGMRCDRILEDGNEG
jgi:hypothetical protein